MKFNIMLRMYTRMISFAVAVMSPSHPLAGSASICPAVAPIPRVMHLAPRNRRDDPTHVALIPELVSQQFPLRKAVTDPASRLIRLADHWRNEQDPDVRVALRQCAHDHFLALARAHSMEGAFTSTDNFFRGWMLSRLSIAYMKIEDMRKMSDDHLIREWFARNADGVLSFQRKRLNDRNINNHFYWGGFGLASVGVLLRNPEYISFSDDVFKIAIANIDGEGLLEAEMTRGAKARHYHLFAAEPIMGMALVTQRPLSATERNAISRLLGAVVEAFAEPTSSAIRRKSGFTQQAEINRSAIRLMSSFRCDSAFLKRLAKVERGVGHADSFLGGDISFLKKRLSCSPGA